MLTLLWDGAECPLGVCKGFRFPKRRSRIVSRVVAYFLNSYESSGDETWPVQIPRSFVLSAWMP